MIGTWDRSLETGNVEIDNQHRALIKLTDELSATDHESQHQVFHILDKVMEFALSHFLMEEELMTHVCYPSGATKEMVEQHREFKSYARFRVLEFRQSQTLSVLPLHSFLDNWLKIHEFGLDRKFADWIRRQEKTSA